jgi:phage/plasmid-like protein (TIGR03299 family)
MADYFDTGFCVRRPSWHGKENLLADYPENWDEARRAAGLMWEPKVLTLKAFDENGLEVPVTEHKAVVRDDTNAMLGVIGKQNANGLVSHGYMGEIFEAILEQPNVKYDTAGSIRGGAQVWASAYIDEPTQVAGDDTLTLPYLALLNAHDGSAALKIVRTSVRVVCANTYAAAELEGQRSGHEFTFRHTATIKDRIEEAKAALTGVRRDHAEWIKLAEELSLIPVSDEQFKLFVTRFVPEPVADVVSDRVRSNIERDRARITNCYLNSVTTNGNRGSALGVINATVEYLDHLRNYRNQDTYTSRTLLRPEPLKARALKTLREVVSAN